MKNTIEISNDLAIPLKNTDVEWNLYVYKKRYKKKVLESYDMYKIDTIQIDNLYSDIHYYITKQFINELEFCEYSTEMPKNKVGFIDLNNNDNILKDSLQLLNESIENYTQFASTELKLHGYVLECKIDGETYLQILSSCSPIKFFKHKYSLVFGNKFSELNEPVLSLNTNCDCIILKNYALFFTGKAESIFDLEKHYKAIATKSLDTLKDTSLINNFDTFREYASAWPRAAKFENFDSERILNFSKLNIIKQTEILNNFSIDLDNKGAIIANSPQEMDIVLNFVCGKLLTDFNNDGYEVAYPQKINHQ